MDIWFPYRNVMFLTTIDKFTKYASVHKIKDRTWVSILNAIKERIQFLGKMRKIVFDNESCMLHNAVDLFLKEQQIEIHRTTPHHKTGNSDIERLHGTFNEHIRILACGDKTDESVEEMVG